MVMMVGAGVEYYDGSQRGMVEDLSMNYKAKVGTINFLAS